MATGLADSTSMRNADFITPRRTSLAKAEIEYNYTRATYPTGNAAKTKSLTAPEHSTDTVKTYQLIVGFT